MTEEQTRIVRLKGDAFKWKGYIEVGIGTVAAGTVFDVLNPEVMIPGGLTFMFVGFLYTLLGLVLLLGTRKMIKNSLLMVPPKDDQAVSPVIGVILMVFITVLLAAVIAAFFFASAGILVPDANLTATCACPCPCPCGGGGP